MQRFLEEVARQIAAGDWEDVEEAAYAHKLTNAQTHDLCVIIARGVPSPGAGSDQPALPVDAEGWGFPITTGTQQPTMW